MTQYEGCFVWNVQYIVLAILLWPEMEEIVFKYIMQISRY